MNAVPPQARDEAPRSESAPATQVGMATAEASTAPGRIERAQVFFGKVMKHLFGRTVADQPDPGAEQRARQNRFNYEYEALDLMSREDTARAQLIVRVVALTVLVLLLWAAIGQIDEVTRGDGKVIPSRQLQVVQSLDGGVVSEILVREGDNVEEGQLLLRIDETRATSGVRESAAQVFALKVRQARLKALAEGASFNPPAPQPGNTEEARIVDEERNLYNARVSELQATLSVSEQQLNQREQEFGEARARQSAAQRALAISRQELQKTKPLLSTGAISEVEVLRLDREVSRNRGDVEQAASQIARVQAAISEARRKRQETELQFRNEARRELSDVLGRLSALNQGAVALADKVNKAQVRSPVRGRIQRLLANTVGGVLQPGKDIVEIVPLDDTLVLEARVEPKDIAFIHPGQAASVKFTAYDFSIYGGLEAVVENISPDTLIDERGNAYYLVRVRTNRPEFGADQPIIPGMTATVDILTGKKSVLSYLLKPILKARAYALRER
ncbi:HlyD family type I secretion periplasmic adaptor subunit [Sphaerotilus mobilis]|uniref:Membrane fusion protein (MFP) family protein n=1 Tax=Sphaerotilus mobilis TaxID=47994 RepID=A0A4Q7LT72_9BURK|nr:HlyD family type I secretion periplasmic adaptor subunit [Sphaerotilus mobilis]RZS57854.1 adhesin transport system membrane fusion protein [Sphaerotilus mobilis]